MYTFAIPKVSVIIPVYNVEKYLTECLNSVLDQTLKEIEIICIDDCSTDSSFKILKQYESLDKRIYLLSNEVNRGQSYSRNKGIKIAKGRYIYFLDSDDFIEVNTLEKLYNTAEENQTDVVFFNAGLIYESPGLADKFIGYNAEHKGKYDGIYTGPMLFKRFIEDGDWTASPPRQFFNKDFLIRKHITFYNGIIHEDELFSFIALLKADRAMCISDRLFIRRFRENSTITSITSQKNFEGLFICYCEMMFFWRQCLYDKETNQAIDKHLGTILGAAKRRYQELTRNNRMSEFVSENKAIMHLYQTLIVEESKLKICKSINNMKLEIIKANKNIIIYGAGAVARDVLTILDTNNIGILGFAVSDSTGNPDYIMGNKVYTIDALVPINNEFLIIVATTSKYYKTIADKLKCLSFKNIVYALD